MQDQIADKMKDNVDVDGYYSIDLNDDGVYLAVYPPQGNGKAVDEAKIIEELKSQSITDFKYALLVKTTKEASGSKMKIGELPLPEVEPDIQVLVSRDRMEATLQIIKPKNSKPLNYDLILAKIQNSGIVYGIDHTAIKQAFERPGIQVIAARGQNPTDGQNAYIKHHIDQEAKGKPVELENGKVDFRNLNMFTTVQEGELLAEKIPATQGIAGMDILGNTVSPKPGKDMMFPVGKNVKVVDNKIVAAIAGQLLIANNKIHVIPVIEIKGDVDLSTGNIEFVGNVIVRGSVQAGFTIKAEGNVEVYGTVSGGTIEGKDIIIKMGIQGMGRGYVKAAGNVVTKFIENATVYAGNDVIVSEVVFHSQIRAAKKVIVQGKRGLIAGGKVIAGEEIVAKTAGTQMATCTDLEVGVNPVMREEFQQLRKDIKKLEINLDQAQKAIHILKAMDQSSMPADKREMLLKLTKAQFHLVGQIENMRNRMAEIELAFEEMKYGRIRVSDIIFPGVKIVVGTLIKPIREQLSYSSFFSEDGDIKIGAFN
jgi:uncharacterized protein (DUF342 family)